MTPGVVMALCVAMSGALIYAHALWTA